MQDSLQSDLFWKVLDKFLFQGQPGTVVQLIDDEQYFKVNSAEFPKNIDFTVLNVGASPSMESVLNSMTELSGNVYLIPLFTPWRSLPKSFRGKYFNMSFHEALAAQLPSVASSVPKWGFLWPEVSLASMRGRNWRKDLFSEFLVKTVCFHGHEHPLETSMRRSARLISVFGGYSKEKKSTVHQSAMLNLRPTDEQLQQGITQFREGVIRALNSDVKYSESFYISDIDFGLEEAITFEKFNPAHKTKIAELKHVGEVVQLTDLVEILPVARAINSYDSPENTGGPKMITGRALTPYGLDEQEIKRVEIPSDCNPIFLQQGDLCIRMVWSRSTPIFPVVQLKAVNEPLVAGPCVIVMRPQKGISQIELEFLKEYMASKLFRDVLVAERADPIINVSRLKTLEIPMPDLDLQTAIKEIDQSIQEILQWKNDAMKEREQLFSFQNIGMNRIRVLTIGREIREKVLAAKLTNEFQHRVRSYYPFPLAYRWRTIEAARNTSERYQHILETAEATVAFLAIMGISMAESCTGETLPKAREIVERVGHRAQGISFGDWREILKQASSRRAIKRYARASFYELTHYLQNQHVVDSLDYLYQSRNDFSHGRGPKGRALVDEVENAKYHLEILLEAAEFLVDYPLRYVEEAKWDSLAKTTKIRYRQLTGDHPLTPLQSEVVNIGEIEAGSLYLVDRQGDYHLLRPIMVFRECPECGTNSVFVVDKINIKEKTCLMKSLGHEHVYVEDNARIFDALTRRGLLVGEP